MTIMAILTPIMIILIHMDISTPTRMIMARGMSMMKIVITIMTTRMGMHTRTSMINSAASHLPV